MLFIYTNNGGLMKKKTLMISIIALGCILFLGGYSYQKIQEKNKTLEEQRLLKSIKSHYHTYVITIKDCPLYKKENQQYKKIGNISKEIELDLEDINIDVTSKYFKIKNTNYYIYYKNVEKISNLTEKEKRFKNYLYFNESIKTKDNFSLYQDKKIYKFQEVMEFKVLIKEENQYGVIYNDDLYYIKKEDVSEMNESHNNDKEIAQEIPVTVYHFLYLENEECGEIICNSINQVKEEFNYLKENHYFTLNTKEMEYFIKGKINLPKNSILITIDDGAKATNFLPILDEYQFNATLFLVSSWYPKEDFHSNYLELASHTHNLHTPGICSGGQGSPLKCMDKQKLLTDLKTSRETLNDTDAFCFPFYEYNEYAIEVVKEAGFQTAYIGGSIKVSIGTNPYMIPRITIHNHISLGQYINLIQ